jgi:Rps23 Pro-64 3,4-dihydroxylase Tpa1-like proline 4-hydroxylase
VLRRRGSLGENPPRVTPSDPTVERNPALQAAMVRPVLEKMGRIHLPHFFKPDCAERIYRCLDSETPWQLHLNDGARNFDPPDEQVRLLPEASRVLLLDKVYGNAAANRFQGLYHTFPIFDAYHAGNRMDLYLMRVYEFLNSPPFLDFARAATGVSAIALVDAQATLYRPGHFLTEHDDRAHDKDRVAAYVLNFTREWRADWGGILQFIDADGHVAEGYTPAFNALNLFRVPQRHSVSFVAPYARAGRYSITGWLRTS